jgi:hypothetical protein
MSQLVALLRKNWIFTVRLVAYIQIHFINHLTGPKMEAYIVAAFSSICIRYSAHSD